MISFSQSQKGKAGANFTQLKRRRLGAALEASGHDISGIHGCDGIAFAGKVDCSQAGPFGTCVALNESMKKNTLWIMLSVAVLAFGIGQWAGSYGIVNADSGESPQVDVGQIGADSSLVVYYPSQKKMFVYQPFVGQPVWPCAYSIQLSVPGGTVERQACQNN